MSSPIIQAIKQICDEKNISEASVIETIEAALAAAYRKDFGEKNQNIKVKFDAESGEFEVFDLKTVVEDQELPEESEVEEPEPEGRRGRFDSYQKETPPAPVIGPDGQVIEPEKRFNPKTEIMVTAAQDLKKGSAIGDEIRTDLEVPSAFGRMAAQTAKQVIIQKIREAERTMVFDEFKGREKELVNATVQRREGRMVLIDLGTATAVMPPDEQIQGERYNSGDRVKVYITEVRMTTKGPEVIVSRTHQDIVRKLFSLEIPEVASGVVTIHDIAREAGSRSKVSVSSSDDAVDPIGSCIGQRGTRIQTIISELGGEKIDIIPFEEDPAAYISQALSPAKVASVALHEQSKTADVTVPEDQLSLAIGKGGQNVRLASRLTGWKLNILENTATPTEAASEEVVPEEATTTEGEAPAAEAEESAE